MRVVLSGGGTGGHITPILAIAEALKRRESDVELIYIGEGSQQESQLLKGSGLRIKRIAAGKWRRYPGSSLISRLFDIKTIFLNLRDCNRVIRGILQSKRLLKTLKPDVVFVKGGYVGLPVGLAAKINKIPLVIHESDSVAGITNRILSRYANVIATAFPPSTYRKWAGRKMVKVGIPIRKSQFDNIVTLPVKLAKDLPTVLVLGGSSGAHALNDAVIKQLPALTKNYQLLHVAGNNEYQLIKEAIAVSNVAYRQRYHLFKFLKNELAGALAAADVIISRAGMTTVAEIAYLKKPLILVPHPYLSGGHQLNNALKLEKAGAAVVLKQDKLYTELVPAIESVIGSKAKQRRMVASLSRFSDPHAAEKLATLIIQAAG